jgi:DNA-binding NarL/FixJ family response regulator
MDMVRILIADDHEGTRGVLRVLLQDHPGWTICGEASSNSEVLQKSLELKPDVLVKDWVMPGVSNLEVTREISRRLPDTAIVLFSFHDLPELEAIANAAGVHGVASKNLSSLIPAIEKALKSLANRQSASVDAITDPVRSQPDNIQ